MKELLSRLMRLVLSKRPSAYRQIDSLDGLRGVAVLMVILSHMSIAGMNLVPGLSFAGVGKVGVWLFFIMSSFLLTSQFLYCENSKLLSTDLWLRYFVRRFLRIYPLFTLAMIFSWLFSGTGYVSMDGFNDLISRLTLQNAKGIEWSILVEFHYYIILPAIVLLLVFPLRRSPVYVITAILTAIICADLTRPAISLTSLRPYISIFLCGSLTAYISWRIRPQSGYSIKTRRAFEIMALGILILILLMTPSIYSLLRGKEVPIEFWHSDLTLFAILWSLFIIFYTNGTGYIESFLSSTWMRAIGIISFGLYLWHPPIILIVKKNIQVQQSVQAIAALLLTFAISFITYILVERPFLQINLKRISNHESSSSA